MPITNTSIKTIQNKLILTLLLISPACVFSQCTPTAFSILEANNVKVGVANGQLMWFDGSDQYHEVPAGSGKNTFFSGGLVISATIDPTGSLGLSGVQYGQNGDSFSPGPLSTGGVLLDQVCDDYDRIFELTREMSLTHIQYFDAIDAGTVNEEFPNGYDIPQDILDYPGNGDVTVGLSQQLAPFYDRNEDGLYDPNEGDCPLFTGMMEGADCNECESLNGDMAFFWIDNDQGTGDDNDGEDLGIEIHNVVYAFQTEDDLNNTIFYQKKMINRSDFLLNDFRIGIYADPDIGCATDDFVGSDVVRNMAYAYNGDDVDNGCTGSQGSYGENPPIAGIKLLKGQEGDDGEDLGMTSMAYFSNSAGGQGDPSNAVEFNNYLTGYWANGQPATCGGIGIGGDVIFPFAFPGDSDPTSTCLGWSESSVLNDPGDRRVMMALGETTLAPNESKCITFSTIYKEGQGGIPENIAAIQQVADNVQEAFDNCFESVINGVSEIEEAPFADIFFNMESNVLNLTTKSDEKIVMRIIDDLGKVVMVQTVQKSAEVNLSSLSSSVYIVQLINNEGRSMNKRIVKL